MSGPAFDSLDVLLRELAREPESTPATPPEPSLPPGTRIGRFELVREIGRGGFGIVYEAHDTTLGRSVAFKLVRGGKRSDLRRERLMREAEAAARLSHPNVVTLYDLGTSDHGPFLVLELLQGETLAERIRRERVPIADAMATAVEIANGLAHAHAAGVVHGDVTPGNVFLCSDGRVKVLDLGLARMFGSSESGGGTRGYVAPEVRSGAPASERSDVYALGVVLFSMVTGHMPYRADDDCERPRLRLRDTPELADLVEDMLASDPRERPGDAAEAARRLGAIRDALIDRARADRHPRPARPILWLLGAGMIVVLAASGWLLRRGGGPNPPGGAPVLLAVLPFADKSTEGDLGYLGDGIADYLRAELGRFDSLRVLGRTSSTSLGASAETDAALQSLGIERLITGSIRHAGGRVEVDAELRDGQQRMLWSKHHSRPAAEVLEIQDDLAAGVVRALAVVTGKGGEAPGSAAGGPASKAPRTTVSPELYTEYLKGRQHYYKGKPEDWHLAREAFERVVAAAPGYAPAWAGLATVHYISAQALGAPTPAEIRAVREKALSEAEKAVALDPELPEALSVHGFIRGFLARDWSRGLADLEHALALEPNNSDALRRYSELLATQGRIDDALAAAERAADRDPLDPKSWAALALIHSVKGDLEHAERDCERSLAVSPGGMGLVRLPSVLLLRGKYREALAAFDRTPELYRLSGSAMAEHSLGHETQARAAVDALTTKHTHDGAMFIAEAYAWMGEKDAAFRWVERAITNGEPEAAAIAYRPAFRPLRADMRFPEVLRRLHLPVN